MRHFLRIYIDNHGIYWTRLSNYTGTNVTLQELPSPLRRRVSRLFHKWQAAGFSEIVYDTKYEHPFYIDLKRYSSKDLSMRSSQIESLQLIAWWLYYTRSREIALQKLLMYRMNPHWLCVDCSEELDAKRICCNDPRCVSWDKLYKCTHDPVFRPSPNPSNT